MPVADTVPPEQEAQPQVAKPVVKAKKPRAPKSAVSAPAPVLEPAPPEVAVVIPEAIAVPAAAEEIEEPVPPPAFELLDSAPLEAAPAAASDSSAIGVASPEPLEVDAPAAETPPVEPVSVEAADVAVATEASAEVQSDAVRDDYPSSPPVLEDLLHLVTDRSLFFSAAPDLLRQNLDMVVDSSSAATAGLESLSQEIVEFGLQQFDEMFAAWKRLLQTGTPMEGFASQCDYTRSVLDDFLGEGAKLTNAMLKFASDVAEPITRPYGLGVS